MIRNRTHILCMDCLGPMWTKVPVPDVNCDWGSSDSSKNNMCKVYKQFKSRLLLTSILSVRIRQNCNRKLHEDIGVLVFSLLKDNSGLQRKNEREDISSIFTCVVQIYMELVYYWKKQYMLLRK
jgi:hypothetical protein